jgi:diguanylate cyclase (GGDEF)-like protein
VLILVAALLARLRAALLEARHFASIDPLTGALNRRAFQTWAERERLRAVRAGTVTSVVYMDLDDFKAVNDRLGHRAGDRLLTSFAAAVAGAIRGTDLFARIGGDEFVVLLPDTDVRSAMRVADRLKRVSCSACDTDSITASVGIATFRSPPDTVDEMVDAADVQMYRAKGAGRGRIAGVLVDAEERRLEHRLFHEDAPFVDRVAG